MAEPLSPKHTYKFVLERVLIKETEIDFPSKAPILAPGQEDWEGLSEESSMGRSHSGHTGVVHGS